MSQIFNTGPAGDLVDVPKPIIWYGTTLRFRFYLARR